MTTLSTTMIWNTEHRVSGGWFGSSSTTPLCL